MTIGFRQLAMTDLPMLHEWLQRAHVAEWWSPTPSLEEVVTEFAPLTESGHRDQGYIA